MNHSLAKIKIQFKWQTGVTIVMEHLFYNIVIPLQCQDKTECVSSMFAESFVVKQILHFKYHFLFYVHAEINQINMLVYQHLPETNKKHIDYH